ncbi:hypothetical protein B9Z19DRAFT_1091020 [Tuber borchii]|uniref:Carbamoyl phosphate synthase preATP-grasp domain-containing protein n=1 Tax=Tuber borchii TaxID=42251 RepID=A0A2T6ZI43_TUBBO|nr:hypothetical protein B9Z19DRAFT_1091020 [Tuber borchii]
MALPRSLALWALLPSLIASSRKAARSLSLLPKLLPTPPATGNSPPKTTADSQRWLSIQQAVCSLLRESYLSYRRHHRRKRTWLRGAIAGGRDLVDVTKVQVIGSGGLSIGQAGEFDYSGKGAIFCFGDES